MYLLDDVEYCKIETDRYKQRNKVGWVRLVGRWHLTCNQDGKPHRGFESLTQPQILTMTDKSYRGRRISRNGIISVDPEIVAEESYDYFQTEPYNPVTKKNTKLISKFTI